MRYIVLFLSCLLSVYNEEHHSNITFLCADETCSEPILKATAVVKYSPDHVKKMKLEKGDKLSIYGKSDEISFYLVRNPKLMDLWQFVPLNTVKIIKHMKSPNISVQHTLPSEMVNTNSKKVPNKQINDSNPKHGTPSSSKNNNSNESSEKAESHESVDHAPSEEEKEYVEKDAEDFFRELQENIDNEEVVAEEYDALDNEADKSESHSNPSVSESQNDTHRVSNEKEAINKTGEQEQSSPPVDKIENDHYTDPKYADAEQAQSDTSVNEIKNGDNTTTQVKSYKENTEEEEKISSPTTEAEKNNNTTQMAIDKDVNKVADKEDQSSSAHEIKNNDTTPQVLDKGDAKIEHKTASPAPKKEKVGNDTPQVADSANANVKKETNSRATEVKNENYNISQVTEGKGLELDQSMSAATETKEDNTSSEAVPEASVDQKVDKTPDKNSPLPSEIENKNITTPAKVENETVYDDKNETNFVTEGEMTSNIVQTPELDTTISHEGKDPELDQSLLAATKTKEDNGSSEAVPEATVDQKVDKTPDKNSSPPSIENKNITIPAKVENETVYDDKNETNFVTNGDMTANISQVTEGKDPKSAQSRPVATKTKEDNNTSEAVPEAGVHEKFDKTPDKRSPPSSESENKNMATFAKVENETNTVLTKDEMTANISQTSKLDNDTFNDSMDANITNTTNKRSPPANPITLPKIDKAYHHKLNHDTKPPLVSTVGASIKNKPLIARRDTIDNNTKPEAGNKVNDPPKPDHSTVVENETTSSLAAVSPIGDMNLGVPPSTTDFNNPHVISTSTDIVDELIEELNETTSEIPSSSFSMGNVSDTPDASVGADVSGSHRREPFSLQLSKSLENTENLTSEKDISKLESNLSEKYSKVRVTSSVTEPTPNEIENPESLSEKSPKILEDSLPLDTPSAELPPSDGNVVSESSLEVNNQHPDSFYSFIPHVEKSNKQEEPPKIHEKGIFEVVFEYMPNFSSLSNLGVIFSTDYWFPKKEIEKSFCDPDQVCDGVIVHPMKDVDIGLDTKAFNFPLWGEVTPSEREWLVASCSVLVVTICLAILLYVFNCGQSKNRVRDLIGLVNRLENKLLVATKEILSLQDELDITKTAKAPVVQTLSIEKKEAIKEAFNKQLKQYQERNTKLEDTVTYLEKELESVSNYALEMHKLFETSLSTQSTSKAAIDEVDDLRALTEKQEIEIDDLRREMDSILIENQMLKENNDSSKAALKKLENECSLQIKKSLELSEKQKELTLQLDKETENNSILESQYKSEIYELRSKIEDLQMNLKRSEFHVEALNRAISERGEDDMCDDSIQLKSQLSTLEAMNNELTSQLKDERRARRAVEEHVGDVTKELNNTKKSFEVCEKIKCEAVTKVQVLTDYFKAEMAKLQKEVEAKEKLFSETENKDQLLSQKLASLKEEIKNHKMQNDALKKEIMDQEASYKTQLANAEQKRQEHWFAYRQTDRKYKECLQEASCLRNRILMLETNSNGKSPDDKNNNDMNGDMAIPIPQLMHPLDISPYSDDFVPPPPASPLHSHSSYFVPPEPIYSTDERLPPLGSRRVPSPSTSIHGDDDDLIPPPPLSSHLLNSRRNEPLFSASYMGRHAPPSNNRHRYKNSRQQQNSADPPSSGVSVESLDKSER